MRKLFSGVGGSARAKASDKGLVRNTKLVESMSLDEKQVLDPEHISLGALIGEGGFAKVYQCQLAGQIAVAKVIPSEQLNEEMIYLLTNECTIWARLAHDNIVSFYGMASTSQSIWLVCESMAEGSLQSQLEKFRAKKAPAPSMHELVDRYTQIAQGMEYLHKFDPPVLHRDLKSANILLGNNGTRLAIADFGLARYQAGPGKKMTAETGSYRWMAPEVIRHEIYGKPCDVYSFAIMAWEMLTYRIPFDNMMPVEAAFAVAREAKRPPIPSSCPSPVSQMLTACWSQVSKQGKEAEDGGRAGMQPLLAPACARLAGCCSMRLHPLLPSLSLSRPPLASHVPSPLLPCSAPLPWQDANHRPTFAALCVALEAEKEMLPPLPQASGTDSLQQQMAAIAVGDNASPAV